MTNENIMRLLAALGGVVALIEAIMVIGEKNLDNTKIISLIIAITLAVLALVTVLTPEKHVPYKWMIFVVLGIVMIAYSSLTGGILVLVAGFVGYTER